MKPGKYFKLSKSVKRVLSTLEGESKHFYRRLMIESQLREEEHKKKSLKKDKETVEE